MSAQSPNPSGLATKILPLVRAVVLAIAAGAAFFGILVIITLARSPVGGIFVNLANLLLATNTVQAMWYVTRAAGLTAYLLLWLSTAWGLAVSSKIFDRMLHRSFTYDFHQFISLLAVGFLVLHIAVLSVDKFLPFSVAQILVPFISPYRPLWVGIGVIGFYLILVVTVTFYMRSQIGMKAFRAIHILSLVGYLSGLVHAYYSGTDSPLLATRLIYAGTLLVVVFLFTYWIILRLASRRPSREAKTAPLPAQARPALNTQQKNRAR